MLRQVLLMLYLWQTLHKSSQESLTRTCDCNSAKKEKRAETLWSRPTEPGEDLVKRQGSSTAFKSEEAHRKLSHPWLGFEARHLRPPISLLPANTAEI